MLGLGTIKRKVFGNANDRKIKVVLPIVAKINKLESDFDKLSDEEIVNKTEEFKTRALGGETLNDLLPEAFANVREAAKRALGLRAFDVQLMGGGVSTSRKYFRNENGGRQNPSGNISRLLKCSYGKKCTYCNSQ